MLKENIRIRFYGEYDFTTYLVNVVLNTNELRPSTIKE